jgi:putative ATPase
MDLFEHNLQEQIAREAPLAARMRPRTLDEFAGQAHIVGPGRLLRRAIQADQLSSLIFYGPPGTGKTTLAMVIANTTQSHFITINAVLSGVKDIREAIAAAQEHRRLYGRRTILFVDEVHRWNKAQQDALLPWVENGTVILIGATTENPYFSVNRPLVSRSRIFQLKSLTEDDLRQIAWQALRDPEHGYGALRVEMHADALDHLVNVANGDARGVLNALELAVETTPPNEQGAIVVDMAVAEESIQRRAVLYDKDGDAHYDTISAFIKSLRGSDPDAALYWLAKMVYAGEDPRFIFRRMLIFCGEDVGLADPNAIRVVTACAEAFDRVGLPEGRFHLAEATLYLATAPKSNSAMAFFEALSTVEREREGEVPTHLRDASRDKEGFGHGEGYLYPHAYRDHWVEQQYLPTSLQGKVFYTPSEEGHEKGIHDTVIRRREAQLAAMVEGGQVAPPEVLTYSPADRSRDHWLQRTLSGASEQLAQLRDRVMDGAQLQRHHVVLDLNAGTGLLTWEAVRRAPEGGVWALVADEGTAEGLREQAVRLDELARPHVLAGDVGDLPAMLVAQGQGALLFDAVVGRSALTQATPAERARAAQALAQVLAQGGRVSLAQVVPRHTQRICRLVDLSALPHDLAERIRAAEEAIYARADDPWVNWDASDLEAAFREAGFEPVLMDVATQHTEMLITPSLLERWFSHESTGGRPSYAQHLSRQPGGLNPNELATYRGLLERTWLNQPVQWQMRTAFLIAERTG